MIPLIFCDMPATTPQASSSELLFLQSRLMWNQWWGPSHTLWKEYFRKFPAFHTNFPQYYWTAVLSSIFPPHKPQISSALSPFSACYLSPPQRSILDKLLQGSRQFFSSRSLYSISCNKAYSCSTSTPLPNTLNDKRFFEATTVFLFRLPQTPRQSYSSKPSPAPKFQCFKTQFIRSSYLWICFVEPLPVPEFQLLPYTPSMYPDIRIFSQTSSSLSSPTALPQYLSKSPQTVSYYPFLVNSSGSWPLYQWIPQLPSFL